MPLPPAPDSVVTIDRPHVPALALSPIVAGLWRIAEWKLDVQARVRWIEQALELGIDSFDHADIYGDYRAEALFGEAIKAAPALRGRMQLVTKCGIRLRSAGRPYKINHYDTSAAYVRAQVEQRLGESMLQAGADIGALLVVAGAAVEAQTGFDRLRAVAE